MSAARLTKVAALKIPTRIERGPTDILKALATTVKLIPNEPESTLQDDPYLLPTRPNERWNYILSKLSGIKTAKFLLNKHPELFFRDDAEPKVEAFLPKEEFSPDMEFTEDDIKWCIENSDSINGVMAYKSLEAKQIKLSNETLLNFFEMICFTNEEGIVDLIERERFRFAPESEDRLVNQTWKTSGLASKIFNQIKEDLDPPRVYSAMIAGLSKFNEHATAREVFHDFCERHPKEGLYNTAYQGLLDSVPRINSSVETAHQAVDEIVRHMEGNLVMPNLAIFNSILKCYRSFQCEDDTCKRAFALLNDMKSLNIEPSLSTLASLLFILTRFKSGRVYNEQIVELLSYIESSDSLLVVRDTKDINFLAEAMNSIAFRLNNLKLAHRVHKIYMKKPNLFESHKSMNRYLNQYFKLIVTTDSLENILNFYEAYVPMKFQPTPDCYEALAEALDLYQADSEVVKRIGEDLIKFGLAHKVENDAIFRKDPDYVEALAKHNERRQEFNNKKNEQGVNV